MAEQSRKEELASTLPEEWRAAFCRFVETGEAEKAFLDFLESNKAAQAVVEIIFNEQAAALERLGAMLHSSKTKTPGIGDLDGGGVYVGKSATTGKGLHAAIADEPDYLTLDEALAAAEQLKSLHPTAHVPTPEELDKNLFENRFTGHLKDTFNTSGSYPGSVYRSSASYGGNHARVQWFGDGGQNFGHRSSRLPVRLVW